MRRKTKKGSGGYELPAALRSSTAADLDDGYGYPYAAMVQTYHPEARSASWELFVAHLTGKERRQLEIHGFIEFTGSLGLRYRLHIAPGMTHYQIARLDPSGRHERLFCVHAFTYNGMYANYLPMDSALAIMLTIKHDEADFLHRAVIM